MAEKRKRTAISIERKIEIIEYHEKNSSLKKKEVADHLGIKKQTLNDILKNKQKTLEEARKSGSRADTLERKRLKLVTFEDVDAALIIWFRQLYEKPDLRIDGEMLLEKACMFAGEIGHESKPDRGWINRWKKRWRIGKIQKVGEAGGVDLEIVDEWKEGKMTELIRKYKPRDIYNCDETGLFWAMLPEKSLGFVGHQQRGAKQSKCRLTLLVGTNMDGSDKMKMFAIGKSQKPRAFKNVKNLPVRYAANHKAWMRSDLFEAEMKRFDRRMKLENRKVVMIVDNCPAHPDLELDNTELVFLPPNTTSVTQPMDAGIIKNFKFYYRRILASARLEAAEGGVPFKWNMLDCLLAVQSSWRQVKASTIVNCWRKAGFVAPSTADGDDDSTVNVDDDADEQQQQRTYRNIWERLNEVLDVNLPSADDYIAVDDEEQTNELLTDKEIVDQVRSEQHAVGDSDTKDDHDGDEEEEAGTQEATPPSMREARAALETLRSFLMNSGELSEENQETLFNAAGKFETLLIEKVGSVTKQKLITDFFQKKD